MNDKDDLSSYGRHRMVPITTVSRIDSPSAHMGMLTPDVGGVDTSAALLLTDAIRQAPTVVHLWSHNPYPPLKLPRPAAQPTVVNGAAVSHINVTRNGEACASYKYRVRDAEHNAGSLVLISNRPITKVTRSVYRLFVPPECFWRHMAYEFLEQDIQSGELRTVFIKVCSTHVEVGEALDPFEVGVDTAPELVIGKACSH